MRSIRRAAIPSPDLRRDNNRLRRPRATGPRATSLRSNAHRRIAERIRRTVAAFQTDLMRAVAVGEPDPEIVSEREAACRLRMRHHLRGGHAVRIELVIPRRVKRVGPVD